MMEVMNIDIDALADELTSAANIVTNGGYYEIDTDAVVRCLDKALTSTRAELAALKAREVGYVQAMDAMGEELAASKERERETLAVLQTAHESEAALVAEREALRQQIWHLKELLGRSLLYVSKCADMDLADAVACMMVIEHELTERPND